MPNRTDFNIAADAVVRAVGVATYPVTEFVNFIAARGYSEEVYDARYDIRPLTENMVRGTFSLIATAVDAVKSPDFNFLDLVEAKVSKISDAVRAPFANDNVTDEDNQAA
ncbi:hypothetical protein [Govanella unica]|uniref:Uncharacterized protein n=1 Tax=Govanella unica TaxID=2975056 RepID=A0A9X3U0G3_9PROT|nr:hypothetical protein [Govania unica]MDA5195089.1 hypothetical protein [Govania unica]